MNENHKKEVDRLSKELSAKHYEAQDKLTREQLADAIGQAILSGDFTRHIAFGERQQVMYVPGAEADRLREALRRCQTVYVLITPRWENPEVEGVFSTREEAEEAQETLPVLSEIYERTIGEQIPFEE